MKRNQSLDVLRGVAVLLVTGFHFPYYSLWARVGWIGVDLFFVLSGFLISGLLFQEYKERGSISFGRFILRRGLKIWPSFYLFLLAVYLFSLYKPSHLLREQILYNLVWVQNYHASDSPLLIHTWSLAVEEHFYLLLPALLMVLIWAAGGRDPFRAIPALFFTVSALCLVLRWLLPSPILGSATHTRIDSLFAGVALGYLYHFKETWFRKLTGNHALVLAAISCTPAALFRGRWSGIVGFTGLFVGFSLLVAWSVVRSTATSRFSVVWRFAAKIGFYSYSIYMWHTAVLYVTSTYLGFSALAFWIYVTFSILIGIAMARVVEIPFLALRQKLFPPYAKPAILAAYPP
ncbi:MAG: acyltransferase family protein [Candidatus Acidiferrales bacterium]